MSDINESVRESHFVLSQQEQQTLERRSPDPEGLLKIRTAALKQAEIEISNSRVSAMPGIVEMRANAILKIMLEDRFPGIEAFEAEKRLLRIQNYRAMIIAEMRKNL